MTSQKSSIAEVLAPLGTGPEGTGAVSTRPSTLDAKIAEQTAQDLDLRPIFRDLGVVAAREMADALQVLPLRPADYADQEGLAELVAKRLAEELASSETFRTYFIKHLRMRG